jgi:hypothetical protein
VATRYSWLLVDLLRSKNTQSPLQAMRSSVSFAGQTHTTMVSLYKAASAARDGPEDAFLSALPALAQVLQASGELPSDPARTLRLRRVKSTTVKRTFFHLVADLADGTTTSELSLKKACRAALRGGD